jgi:methylmalonyl-CoA mutase C-terminal domain/subunit
MRRMCGEMERKEEGRSVKRKIRILIAKPGLDGHDRGAKIVARALRDAGMEVIYTGRRQTPEQIVTAAIQEGVDAVGLSILSGAHLELVNAIAGIFEKKGVRDIPLFVGGIIPKEDEPALKDMGVVAVFGPGAYTADIAAKVETEVSSRRGDQEHVQKD